MSWLITNPLKLFKKSKSGAAPEPGTPRRVTNRLHIFYGDFASELEATDYCITPQGRNGAVPLARDLPDAVIDPSEVEIIFGTARIAAIIPMLTPGGLTSKVGDHNTVVMVSEMALSSLPHTLSDTPLLRYAGAFDAR